MLWASSQGKEFSSLSQLHKPCQWLRFSFRDVQKCKTLQQGISCRDPQGWDLLLKMCSSSETFPGSLPCHSRHMAVAPKAGEELKVVQNAKILQLLALTYSSDPACCSGSTQASLVPSHLLLGCSSSIM